MRQLRNYWSLLDAQTQKREATKTRVEKETSIELNNNKRKEEYLHWCHSQYKYHPCSPMKLFFDLSYIKKITLKRERKKLKLNLYRNLLYSLLDRFLYTENLQVFITNIEWERAFEDRGSKRFPKSHQRPGCGQLATFRGRRFLVWSFFPFSNRIFCLSFWFWRYPHWSSVNRFDSPKSESKQLDLKSSSSNQIDLIKSDFNCIYLILSSLSPWLSSAK